MKIRIGNVLRIVIVFYKEIKGSFFNLFVEIDTEKKKPDIFIIKKLKLVLLSLNNPLAVFP